jgi:hypothetical protein
MALRQLLTMLIGTFEAAEIGTLARPGTKAVPAGFESTGFP